MANFDTNRPYIPRGSQHWNAKLTESDVLQILELNAHRVELKKQLDAVSQSAIAEKFGISKQRVWEICASSRGAWGHI